MSSSSSVSESESVTASVTMDVAPSPRRERTQSNGIRLSELSPELAAELSALDETGDGVIDETELLHAVREQKRQKDKWSRTKRRYRVTIPLGLIALVGVVAAVFGITYSAAQASKEVDTGRETFETDEEADPTASVAYSTETNQPIKTMAMPYVVESTVDPLDLENLTDDEQEAVNYLNALTLADTSASHLKQIHRARGHDSSEERKRASSANFEAEYRVQFGRAKSAFKESKLHPAGLAVLTTDLTLIETGDKVEDVVIDMRVHKRVSDSFHFFMIAQDINNLISGEIAILCIKHSKTCVAGQVAGSSRRRGSYCDLSGHTSSYTQKSTCRTYNDENTCENDSGCYWVNSAGGYCWVVCASLDYEDECEDVRGSESTGPLCYWKDNDCFSGESTVQLEDGSARAMGDLQPGDVVQVDVNEFAPVSFFDAQDADVDAAMMSASLADGSKIHSTGSHGWMVDGKLKALKDLQPGDAVVKADGTTTTVVKLAHELKKGMFSPVTTKGTIVVDGVLASCYAPPSGISQTVAHTAVAPLRALAYLSPSWAQTASRSLIYWLGDVKSAPAEQQNVFEATFLAGLLSMSKLTQ